MYRPILLTVTAAATLVAGTLIAHGRDSLPSSVPTAPAAVEGTSRIDDAVAAALIGSISGQFSTDDVTVQLGRVDVAPASIRDREVRGTGRLRIDGDPQWIPFRFAALYDTELAEVSQPRLELQAPAVAARAADAGVARDLQARVAQALTQEFAGQPVAWTQRSAVVAGGDARYVRVTGTGLADFGPEGSVDARVDALYDRVTSRWLRVSYELGQPVIADATLASL